MKKPALVQVSDEGGFFMGYDLSAGVPRLRARAEGFPIALCTPSGSLLYKLNALSSCKGSAPAGAGRGLSGRPLHSFGHPFGLS